jgi:hypothetical protein
VKEGRCKEQEEEKEEEVVVEEERGKERGERERARREGERERREGERREESGRERGSPPPSPASVRQNLRFLQKKKTNFQFYLFLRDNLLLRRVCG